MTRPYAIQLKRATPPTPVKESGGAMMLPPNLAKLSPRRLDNLRRLVRFLHWHGGKTFLDAAMYAAILAEQGMERHAVDQAADDGWESGELYQDVTTFGRVSVAIIDFEQRLMAHAG